MSKKISIIDYGMGNIGSILNALTHLGIQGMICSKPSDLDNSQGIILPGVGAFPAAMKNLKERGFVEKLNQLVLEQKTPFLGICLGLQLIAEDSTEHEGHPVKGLSWIEGHVVNLKPDADLPVPHVGWNNLKIKNQNQIFDNIKSDAAFYFDHSYHLTCPSQYVIAYCDYGGDVVAAVQHNNIMAMQFHPEKSQRSGLKVLRNFANFVKNPRAISC